MSKPFYITTTIPYVNADPHIGFALELVQADIVARYKKLRGFDVFFNTGTDEHGIKIYRKAVEMGQETKLYVDAYAEKFKGLATVLGLSEGINFIRTTDPHHKVAAREFWKRCLEAGDIYKKNYKIKYCVGCELEKTDSELVNGKCAVHPNLELEIIEEENYFFRLSNYQKKLLALYESRKDFVVPEFRLNEIHSLIKEKGLEDFSISRLKEKMPWGVSVPDDDLHVMYVWFDALVNYISAIGWPDDMEKFKKWWPVVQFAGKDQVRQQAVMWQAMLMSVGIEPSKQVVIHGFITSGGQKMSKSLGNVVDPVAIVNEYGTDVLRYYLSRHIHPFEDSDFTMEKFKDVYNANLANGLGNLVSRVMKMATANGIKFDLKIAKEFAASKEADTLYKKQTENFEKYNILEAVNAVWELIGITDGLIQSRQPFKKIKENKEGGEEDIKELLARIDFIGNMLVPILPETSAKIISLVKNSEMPKVPLFPRRD